MTTKLGEFLLAGPWAGSLEAPERSLVFAFNSAQARTAFWKKWEGAAILLPGAGEIKLGSCKKAKDGDAFMLEVMGGTPNAEKIRKAIERKLQGMSTGHGPVGLTNFATRQGISTTREEVVSVAEDMVAEGILELHSTTFYGTLYRFADRGKRHMEMLESGSIEDMPE